MSSVTATSVPRTALRLPASAVHGGVGVVALVCWVLALAHTHLGAMDDFGLISVLPDSWYLAFLVLLTGFAVTAWRTPARTVVLALYLVALVVVLDATMPLLYDAPRYAWTYKHLAVTDLIATTGTVDRSIDIYNNWPGFFAITGWLQDVSGVRMIHAAAWAPLVFDGLNLVVVHYVLRAVTDDRRRIWIALLLFLLANWMGLNYFSPQAEGFVLSMIVIGVLLRVTTPRRLPRALARRLDLTTPAADPVVGDMRAGAARDRGDLVAPVVGGLAWIALVVSHQLSPVMVIASVVALAFVRRVPFWVLAAMIAVELAWVALAWGYLSATFQLVDPNGVAVRHIAVAATPPPGVGVHGMASKLSAAVAVGLAVVGALRLLATRRIELSVLALLVAPFPVAMAQSYGGEAFMRAYLFSLPWMALLGAAALVDLRLGRPRLRAFRAVALAGVIAVMATGYLVANTGLELINRITASDVQSAEWYEANAPAGSTLVVLAGNFPAPLSRVYPTRFGYGENASGVPVLMQFPEFSRPASARRRVTATANLGAALHGRQVFVAISPSQRRYIAMSGLMPERDVTAFTHALSDSSRFRLVYDRDGSSIYRYVPARTTS